jgi:hypothetical protein
MTSKLETAVVTRQVNSRGWTTYTDLLVLSRNLQMQKLWSLLAECTFKVKRLLWICSPRSELSSSIYLIGLLIPGRRFLYKKAFVRVHTINKPLCD